MPESFTSRLLRWKFNLVPAYRGSGGRVTYNVDLIDAEGIVYASIEKVIYVRRVAKSQSLKVSKSSAR